MKEKKSKFFRRCALIMVIIMSSTYLVACGAESNSEGSESKSTGEPTKGGELTAAFQSAPDNFDPDHPSKDWVVTAVTNHVYEGLFEFSANNEAIPHLAESYSVLDDGKTYEIILRKGVKFQDGEEMVAEDVKASMERWFKVNAAGISIAESLKEIEIVDDYKLLVEFDKVYAPFINILASPVSRQKMLVKKKEIVDEFGESIITEHIGTGPYYFDEISMGQRVVLKRNENYTPVEVEASGLSGNRTAYLDKVTIEFVPEESVRVAGLKSGQFDFIDELSTDRYSEVEDFPEVSPTAANFGTIGVVAFNSGKAPFNDVNLRRSVAHAINPQDMAAAQIGDSKFWSVEDGSWFTEGSIWHDETAGEGIYNSNNMEKAKEYIEKSNYNGETITILGAKEDMFISNGALVLKEQLEEAGIKAEVELYDQSTYSDYRENGDWNIVLSRWSDMNPDPQVFEPWTGTDGWITNWDDEDSRRMDEIFKRMESEVDYEKRYEIVKEFYDEFWSSVPYLKVFNDKRLYGIKDNVEGYAGYGQPFFWNVWIEE